MEYHGPHPTPPSVHENHRTCQTFPMARPKCLMRDFTNLNRTYEAHQTNVWWTMKVFRLHCPPHPPFHSRSKCPCSYSGINKNTLETCKNPRPTSGWSELTKSCTTSTMNFHMAYFSWIPQNNARLKLSCKFGESNCNPYWYITLTISHGMNYVLNEHLDVSQHDPCVIPSVTILWYS